MKNIKYFLIIIIAIMSSCEDMEDTYSDFTGNGKIRYVGKCTDLKIESGWERLKLSWKNSADPTIDSTKIVWEIENVKDSVVLKGDVTSYETDANLENKEYVFNVYAIDDKGNHSLKTTGYGNPFTNEHILVKSFYNMEDKHFFIEDNLIVFWGDYNSNITNSYIAYYQDGIEKKIPITQDIIGDYLLELNNLDEDKDVTITRSGLLEECYDTIHFNPYKLLRETSNFRPDFTEQLKSTYNLNEIDSEFINNLKVLSLDYNLTSLDDVLSFPDLEKIIIGGNRFMHPSHLTESLSLLEEQEVSVFLLDKLQQLKGVEVEIYNNHYGIVNYIPFATDGGNPTFPTIDPLNTEGWSITSSTEEEGYDSNPVNLLDNNVNTLWKPLTSEAVMREHELVIDMKAVKEIKGFVVTQPENTVAYDPAYYPANIQVLISNDGVIWENPFSVKLKPLGKSPGERTILKLKEALTTQFVKIKLIDNDGVRKNVLLADFVIY